MTSCVNDVLINSNLFNLIPFAHQYNDFTELTSRDSRIFVFPWNKLDTLYGIFFNYKKDNMIYLTYLQQISFLSSFYNFYLPWLMKPSSVFDDFIVEDELIDEDFDDELVNNTENSSLNLDYEKKEKYNINEEILELFSKKFKSNNIINNIENEFKGEKRTDEDYFNNYEETEDSLNDSYDYYHYDDNKEDTSLLNDNFYESDYNNDSNYNTKEFNNEEIVIDKKEDTTLANNNIEDILINFLDENNILYNDKKEFISDTEYNHFLDLLISYNADIIDFYSTTYYNYFKDLDNNNNIDNDNLYYWNYKTSLFRNFCFDWIDSFENYSFRDIFSRILYNKNFFFSLHFSNYKERILLF